MSNILEAALEVVKERGQSYGSPTLLYNITAELMRGLFKAFARKWASDFGWTDAQLNAVFEFIALLEAEEIVEILLAIKTGREKYIQ